MRIEEISGKDGFYITVNLEDTLPQTTTISASTSETTIVTAAASTFNDLMMLIVSNTSATAARLDFRDATAGSQTITVSTTGVVFIYVLGGFEITIFIPPNGGTLPLLGV